MKNKWIELLNGDYMPWESVQKITCHECEMENTHPQRYFGPYAYVVLNNEEHELFDLDFCFTAVENGPSYKFEGHHWILTKYIEHVENGDTLVYENEEIFERLLDIYIVSVFRHLPQEVKDRLMKLANKS